MPPLVVEKPRIWKFNNIEAAPNCPRCASSNTKFCYYNNYSFSQPRYFCKGCKRYWTKGGSLRKVPVGGGCRKSRPSREKQGGGSNYPPPAPTPKHVGSTNTSENDNDVDLAAVFAKYVDQNVDNKDYFTHGAAICDDLENVVASSLDLGGQMEGVGMINGVDDPVLTQLSIHAQGFVYRNSNEFELQGVINDEPPADVLWSNSTDLQNFESQQSMDQVGNFRLFSPDNNISGNLLGDDWGLFDLSGCDFF